MTKPLSYPDIGSGAPDLNEKTLVYLIKKHPLSGVSHTITKEGAGFLLQISDWKGEVLGKEAHTRPVFDVLSKALSLVKCARIKQSQWYFSQIGDEYRLVDVRKSMDEFIGPGLLRDLCGKALPTQEILFIGDLLAARKKMQEEGLTGNVIIKPARFRTFARGEEQIPLYILC